MREVSYAPHCQATHIQVLGTFPCYSGMSDKQHAWGTRDQSCPKEMQSPEPECCPVPPTAQLCWHKSSPPPSWDGQTVLPTPQIPGSPTELPPAYSQVKQIPLGVRHCTDAGMGYLGPFPG